MAAQDVTPIPLCLPQAEATALAQLCKRVDRGTVAGFAAPCTTYDDRPEADVMWDGMNHLRSALAEAGFGPR
jgi:hypothetical protein